MGIFSSTYTKAGYVLDSIFYITVITIGLIILSILEPIKLWPSILFLMSLGLFSWTFFEYFIHRFVLHGDSVLQRAHALHHDNPYQLIATSTLFGATLFTLILFVPSLLLTNFWIGTSFTLGNLIGYTYYGWFHFMLHRQSSSNKWLKNKKKFHAIHHNFENKNFGVTTSLWDHIFRTL